MDLQKLDHAKYTIDSFDLQPVIDRLTRVEKWSKDDAVAVIKQYRRYLFLRRKYPNQILPPSKEIDDAWHAHILHTRAYRKFCQQVFDYNKEQFLDHNPAEDEQSTVQFDKFFEQTQSLYKKEFGEYIYQVRGRSILRKMLEKIGDRLIARFPHLAMSWEQSQ